MLGVLATAEFHKTEIETLYKSKYKSVFSKHSKVVGAAVKINQHAKKASEAAAGRVQPLELTPNAGRESSGLKNYQIGAGVSRTEVHGHKRKGAASMEVKPAGTIGLST